MEIAIEIFDETKKKKTKKNNIVLQTNKTEKKKSKKSINENTENILKLNIPKEFDFISISLNKNMPQFDLKSMNDIDSEIVPDFIYLENNLINENLHIYFSKAEREFKKSISQGSFQIVCNCKNECNEDCVCARYNKQYLKENPPYKIKRDSIDRKILTKEIIQENIKPFTHIFECSKYCSCNKNLCNYQLLGWKDVKMVRESDLIVKRYKKKFKNSNEEITMWGLMTDVKIPKNTLVIEYVGEIISKSEADLRGKYYDSIGKNYLFDLTMSVEYKGENKFGAIFCIDNYMKYRKIEEKQKLLSDFPLCIDSFYYGNLSRFINHSCNPNLQVLSIHVENREILLPRVILFSTREIEAGEELTFDYNCYPLSTDKELKCACGESECRGFIYN